MSFWYTECKWGVFNRKKCVDIWQRLKKDFFLSDSTQGSLYPLTFNSALNMTAIYMELFYFFTITYIYFFSFLTVVSKEAASFPLWKVRFSARAQDLISPSCPQISHPKQSYLKHISLLLVSQPLSNLAIFAYTFIFFPSLPRMKLHKDRDSVQPVLHPLAHGGCLVPCRDSIFIEKINE